MNPQHSSFLDQKAIVAPIGAYSGRPLARAAAELRSAGVR